MNRTYIFVIAIVLSALMAFSTAASATRGRVIVRDNTIKTDIGTLIRGARVSLDIWDETPSQAEIDAIKSRGLNALHIYAEFADSNRPGGYNAAKVDNVVNLADKNDLYVILTIGCGGSNGSFNRAFVEQFWNFYAPRYKDRTHVIYEIMNEPQAWSAPYNNATLDMERSAYQLIRKYAPDTHIMMMSYSQPNNYEAAANESANLGISWSNASVAFHTYGIDNNEDRVLTGFFNAMKSKGIAYACTEPNLTLKAITTKIFERDGVSETHFISVHDIATDKGSFDDWINANGIHWTSDFAAGAGCASTAIASYIQINDGSWQQSSGVTVNSGDTVKIGPQPVSGGSWSWSGGGTSGSAREQTLHPTSSITATATYTNSCGATSSQTFSIAVSGSGAANGGGGADTIVHLTKRNASGFAIDGNNGGAAGQKVYLWSSDANNANQAWVEMDRGQGFYSYKKANTDFCLDGGNGGANGQNVILWACDANNQNQQWQKIDAGSGNYRLQKRNAAGYSIDGENGGANGQVLYLWASDANNQNQQWTFNAGSTTSGGSAAGSGAVQSGHIYKLQNANSGKVLGIVDGSASDGAKALQWGDNGTRDHEWRIDLLSDGYYKLTNLNSGKVLAVLGMSADDGGEVIQWSDNGTPDHEWKLVGSTGGSYKLVNRNSGKVLGILGRSKDDGATALQWKDNGTADHDWKLVDLGAGGGNSGNSNGDTGSGGAATFTLSVGVSGNGTTSVSAGSHTYQSGTAVSIMATPAQGSIFSGWSGAFTGNTNPLIITMNRNESLTANFSANAAPSTFQNPMLWEDLADIDVFRVDDTFYASASSMHFSPGAPIIRSYDLANWEFAGHSVPVLDFAPQYDMNGGRAYVKGVWASFLNYRKSNKTFYWGGCIEYSKTYIYTATSVEGPWQKHPAINNCYYDAGLLIDDDDTMYVAYGNTDIYVAQLSADGLSEVRTQKVFNSPDVGYIEGSRFYKINGSYYIFVTHPADSEYVLKSTGGPFGPYTMRALVKGVPSPIPGAGSPHQGGIVQTQNGDWYYMAFVDALPGGRIPILAPVNWDSDGWPTVQLVGGAWGTSYPQPVATPHRAIKSPTGVDSFSGASLGPEWEWNHNPDNTRWSTGNGLRLQTATVTNDLYAARNTLTHRVLGPSSTATIVLDYGDMRDGDRTGLALLRNTSAWVGIKRDGGSTRVVMVNNITMDGNWNTMSTGTEVASAAVSGGKIWLRVSGDFRPGDGKQGYFSYSTDGSHFTPIGNGLVMTNNWEFFMAYRFAIFNYATQALGGLVHIDSFEMTAP